MKEYILKELTGLVELTKTGAVKAIEILQVQAPELIKQIMAWEFAVSLAHFMIGVISFLSLVFLVRKAPKWWKDADCEPTIKTFGSIVWGITGVLIGFASISNVIWLKILIAPKLFLIEYFTALIK